MKIIGKKAAGMAMVWGMSVLSILGAQTGRTVLSGHVPAITSRLTPMGSLPATNRINLAIGLPLHNQPALETLLAQLYDPQSTNFHRFLSPPEFVAQFGPTEAEYENVIQFATTNGLTVKTRHSNRLVLDVEGSAADIGRAFGVNFQAYRHPTEQRDFYAPNQEPSVPAGLPVADMWGMENYNRPRPMVHDLGQGSPVPLNNNGTGPSGYYRGTDFRNAYAPGTVLKGTGQIVAIAEFDGYYSKDITTYEAQAGYSTVPVQSVLLDSVSGTPGYSGVANANLEVSLDIEMAISIAPGLTKVIVVEGSSPYDVFNQIATNNVARQVSCSWAFGYGPNHNWSGHGTLDSILMEMVAQGQSFFEASGDSDAYTGSQALTSANSYIPTDSPYVVSVGGTILNMNGSGASWSSESVWNQGSNVGSGGGISSNYNIPTWQAGVSMATNNGSTVYRNLPDVALTAESVYVIYNSGSTTGAGGTSCAAPLWAGFCALINQQEAAGGVTNSVGFLNPAVYALAATTNYTNCFHDITVGNNIGSHTAGLYYATNGYDLATGLGTPSGTNLINALAPLPGLISQPTNQIVRAGTNYTLTATAVGAPPLSFQWLLAGTNLPGATATSLTLNPVGTNNAGGYTLVVTNAFGAITSSVATLTVVLPPAITSQPASLTVLGGSNAVFSTTLSGNTPLVCQWWKDGSKLTNGTGIAGATTNVLTLTSVTTNSSGNYSLVVTNLYGAATSSVASLTVVLPPTLLTTVSNQTLQCGNNVFNQPVAAAGTAPLGYQWSLDATPVTGATNTSFALTNLSLPSHTISVTVTNLFGSVTNNAVLTVQDTQPPLINLVGTNPLYVELGNTFTDPGAVAYDTCAGSVAVTASGFVNTNMVSTNTLVYQADDGNGNTNTITRTAIVRDTTMPVVLWSFTNLVLVAGTNCVALMPAVTGTNGIIASDASGVLVISQSPTNLALLNIGTNLVIITVADSSGNTAYSTNSVTVLDESVPVMVLQPQSQAKLTGSTAVFNAGASACSPLAYQWYFNSNPLTGATNSTLTQSNVDMTLAGDYFVVASNLNSAVTSSVASLTVGLPPSLVTTISNQTLQCGSNVVSFAVTATGTTPFGYQWSLDAIPVTGATNTTFTLTNLTLPSHTVSVTVTNLYASATSNAVLTVQDTQPPLLSLVGSNLVLVDLGNTFTDPGAVAYDICAGTVAVTVSGSVNLSNLGTNTLVYRADDGNGNTNTITRTVIVQDTNFPAIQWSFTNLVLAANTNCGVMMPDVTGTNRIIASNADGMLVISQSPTNQTFLPIGTNKVIITVADTAGSAVYSTNTIVVMDESAPVLVLPPQNLTNTIGSTAVFSAGATACSPLAYQWYFNNNPLGASTDSTFTQSNVDLSLAGNYFVVATAAGGATTSAVVTLTVNLVAAAVTPASSANPSGFKSSVTFSATVNPTNATGSIQFLTNGVAFDTEPLLAGLATSTNTITLPRGTNWVTVIYSGDAANLAATNVLAQIVTNHPPMGATVSYTYGAGTVLSIALTNLSAQWSDVDGDTVSLAAISQSTNGVTVTNMAGTLTYANPNNVNDQFTCTITDGWGGTNYQTVNLTAILPSISNIASNPDGSLTLQFTGSPGNTYVLEATSTLSPGNWQPVSTNTLNVTGTLNFSLTPDTSAMQSFYRLRLSP